MRATDPFTTTWGTDLSDRDPVMVLVHEADAESGAVLTEFSRVLCHSTLPVIGHPYNDDPYRPYSGKAIRTYHDIPRANGLVDLTVDLLQTVLHEDPVIVKHVVVTGNQMVSHFPAGTGHDDLLVARDTLRDQLITGVDSSPNAGPAVLVHQPEHLYNPPPPPSILPVLVRAARLGRRRRRQR